MSYWGFSEWKKLDKTSKWWLSGAVVLLIGYALIRPPFVVRMEDIEGLGEEEYED